MLENKTLPNNLAHQNANQKDVKQASMTSKTRLCSASLSASAVPYVAAPVSSSSLLLYSLLF